MSIIEESVFARPQNRCVVCGPDNPRGFHIKFESHPEGGVQGQWKASRDWEGFQGVLHGGVISTLLDEAMAKAVLAGRHQAMTCELKVRYRHHVATGEVLRIRGWITEVKKRRILTEARVSTEQGEERAHGWGAFVSLSSSGR